MREAELWPFWIGPYFFAVKHCETYSPLIHPLEAFISVNGIAPFHQTLTSPDSLHLLVRAISLYSAS